MFFPFSFQSALCKQKHVVFVFIYGHKTLWVITFAALPLLHRASFSFAVSWLVFRLMLNATINQRFNGSIINYSKLLQDGITSNIYLNPVFLHPSAKKPGLPCYSVLLANKNVKVKTKLRQYQPVKYFSLKQNSEFVYSMLSFCLYC